MIVLLKKFSSFLFKITHSKKHEELERIRLSTDSYYERKSQELRNFQIRRAADNRLVNETRKAH